MVWIVVLIWCIAMSTNNSLLLSPMLSCLHLRVIKTKLWTTLEELFYFTSTDVKSPVNYFSSKINKINQNCRKTYSRISSPKPKVTIIHFAKIYPAHYSWKFVCPREVNQREAGEAMCITDGLLLFRASVTLQFESWLLAGKFVFSLEIEKCSFVVNLFQLVDHMPNFLPNVTE